MFMIVYFLWPARKLTLSLHKLTLEDFVGTTQIYNGYSELSLVYKLTSENTNIKPGPGDFTP